MRENLNKELHIDTIINRFIYDVETGEIFSNHKYHNNRNKPLGYVNQRGYLQSTINVNGKKYQVLLHRLAWRLHYGEWPKYTINHKNGIKTDNRIENLEDTTIDENNNHSIYTLGKYWWGETHRNAKLNQQQVNEIRKKYKPKEYTLEMLADEYGVNYRTIHYIVQGKSCVNRKEVQLMERIKLPKGTTIHLHGIPYHLVEDTWVAGQTAFAITVDGKILCRYCGEPKEESNHDMVCNYSHGENGK